MLTLQLIQMFTPHLHKCDDCQEVWEHRAIDFAFNSEEFDRQHTCPKCGKTVLDIRMENENDTDGNVNYDSPRTRTQYIGGYSGLCDGTAGRCNRQQSDRKVLSNVCNNTNLHDAA